MRQKYTTTATAKRSTFRETFIAGICLLFFVALLSRAHAAAGPAAGFTPEFKQTVEHKSASDALKASANYWCLEEGSVQ